MLPDKTKYKNLLKLLVAVSFSVLLLHGCADGDVSTPAQTSPPIQMSQTPGISSTGQPNTPGSLTTKNTGSSSQAVWYFPTQKNQTNTQFTNMVQGILVVEDAFLCARDIIHGDEGECRLKVWPYGFKLDNSLELPRVMDAEGRLVAQLGDNVVLSGSGRYSFGGEAVVVDVRSGITLDNFTIETGKRLLFAGNDPTVVPCMPFYYSDRIESDQFNSSVKGTLTVENSYFRLNTKSGKSFMIIWSAARDVRKNEGDLVINDKETKGLFYVTDLGKRMFEGDEVELPGAEVTPEKLESILWFDLPDDWLGPFWIAIKPS